MKNILFALGLLLAFGLSTTACNKDDDSPKSVTELLTAHCWKLSATVDACDEDNTEHFNTDGSYLSDVGIVLCDPGEEDGIGTWVLSADETVLTVTIGTGIFSFSLDFTIEAISENSMTLSLTGLGSGTYVKC